MKKKMIVSLFLTVMILLSGCANKAPEVLTYESALQWLEQSKPDADGKYVVSEQLVFALQNTEFTEAKNVIYMIGDGMGSNIIQATQEKYASQLYGNKLAMNYLTYMGTQSTYSNSDQITDSAAGGTALATGHKTANYTVGMNADHTENYKSLLELAAEKGKSRRPHHGGGHPSATGHRPRSAGPCGDADRRLISHHRPLSGGGS